MQVIAKKEIKQASLSVEVVCEGGCPQSRVQDADVDVTTYIKSVIVERSTKEMASADRCDKTMSKLHALLF